MFQNTIHCQLGEILMWKEIWTKNLKSNRPVSVPWQIATFITNLLLTLLNISLSFLNFNKQAKSLRETDFDITWQVEYERCRTIFWFPPITSVIYFSPSIRLTANEICWEPKPLMWKYWKHTKEEHWKVVQKTITSLQRERIKSIKKSTEQGNSEIKGATEWSLNYEAREQDTRVANTKRCSQAPRIGGWR